MSYATPDDGGSSGGSATGNDAATYPRGGGYDVDPTKLIDFANYVEGLANQSYLVLRDVAITDGMDTTGFKRSIDAIPCLSEALIPTIELLQGNVVSPAVRMLYDKMYNIGDAMREAARNYGLTDQENVRTLERIPTEFTPPSGIGGESKAD